MGISGVGKGEVREGGAEIISSVEGEFLAQGVGVAGALQLALNQGVVTPRLEVRVGLTLCHALC